MSLLSKNSASHANWIGDIAMDQVPSPKRKVASSNRSLSLFDRNSAIYSIKYLFFENNHDPKMQEKWTSIHMLSYDKYAYHTYCGSRTPGSEQQDENSPGDFATSALTTSLLHFAYLFKLWITYTFHSG